MKIKLSRSQWEFIGKKSGWMKKEAGWPPDWTKKEDAKPHPSAIYLDTGFWEIPGKIASEICGGQLPKIGNLKEVIYNSKKYIVQRTPKMGKEVWTIRSNEPV
jgi:hypothetical protein